MSGASLTGPPARARSRRSGEGGRRASGPGVARVLAAALALGLAAGCATKGDLRDVRTEIRALSARQDSLVQLLLRLERATQDSLRVQSDVLFSLRGDVSRQLLQIQEQLVTVQEQTGLSQRALAQLRDQIEARRTAIVEGSGPPDAAGADTTAAAEGPGAGGPGAEAGGPEELYNVAVRQFNRGSVTTARRAFRRFLEAYPNHRLAADAHFYLADVLVQENRLRDAIEAFLEIPELFPTATKVPDALYRAGLLHAELDEAGEARTLFERVVNSYPDSGAAILARERLNELP